MSEGNEMVCWGQVPIGHLARYEVKDDAVPGGKAILILMKTSPAYNGRGVIGPENVVIAVNAKAKSGDWSTGSYFVGKQQGIRTNEGVRLLGPLNLKLPDQWWD